MCKSRIGDIPRVFAYRIYRIGDLLGNLIKVFAALFIKLFFHRTEIRKSDTYKSRKQKNDQRSSYHD